MNGHHLILGELTDYISGQLLEDTLDERHRQKVGRLLVEELGYAKGAITSRRELEVSVDNRCARLLITYCIRMANHIAMIIQYGPGSLVTRHRPALAISRLVAGYQVPVVVVTNGEDADILSGGDGTALCKGLENIPTPNQLDDIVHGQAWPSVKPDHAKMEARILMAYEVDDRCPCDDSVCTPHTPEADKGKTQ